eukprot:SAG11_NODE_823_length_6997_cov_60.301247_4_plen_72_part_00
MILSAAMENRARNRCPPVSRVVETAALSNKAAKTQSLLEKVRYPPLPPIALGMFHLSPTSAGDVVAIVLIE